LSRCHGSGGGAGKEARIPPNGGAPVGLPQRTIRGYAEWHKDRTHAAYQDGTLDTSRLEAELRQKIAERVLPEYVETEFERVMEAVFDSNPR
jgi:hypothetical protein